MIKRLPTGVKSSLSSAPHNWLENPDRYGRSPSADGVVQFRRLLEVFSRLCKSRSLSAHTQDSPDHLLVLITPPSPPRRRL